MYCLGTGDCFLYTFINSDNTTFKMMVDFGSCVGSRSDYLPYMEHLQQDIGETLDLLVITHEHNDHVNGFAKCPEIFNNIEIKRAWFSWTENREDPSGKVKDLLEKRKKLKKSVANAYTKIGLNNSSYTQGLKSLIHENLPVDDNDDLIKFDTDAYYSLPGYIKVKEILESKSVKIEYQEPGTIIEIPEIGLKFYFLGPPLDKNYMFKNEKIGKDVYDKSYNIYEKDLEENAFTKILQNKRLEDVVPFNLKYVMYESEKQLAVESSLNTNIKSKMLNQIDEDKSSRKENFFHWIYNDKKNDWRKIDDEYLNSTGQLALRLNSHINNTSLAMAIEIKDQKKIMLLPGDAEFGSWASWHEIEKWKFNNRYFNFKVADLLSRTFFYKVSHHLSFNGTPTNLGLNLIENEDLVSMATLDLTRIAERWKSTMPNKHLIRDLSKTGNRELIIMNTMGIDGMEDIEKKLEGKNLKINKLGNVIISKEYIFELG